MLRNARKSTLGKKPRKQLVSEDDSGSVSRTSGLNSDYSNRNTWNWDPVMATRESDQISTKGQSVIPRSRISEHFCIEIVAPDCMKARCKYCGRSLAFITRSKRVGTSHLRRHLAIHQKSSSGSLTEDHELSSHEEVDQFKRRKESSSFNVKAETASEGSSERISSAVLRTSAPQSSTSPAGNSNTSAEIPVEFPSDPFMMTETNVKAENASEGSSEGINLAVLRTSAPHSSTSPASNSNTSAKIPVEFPSDPFMMTETFSASRKLVAELSSRTRLKYSSLSSGCQISEEAPSSDFIQRQKEELAAFLNMSLEAIHQTNSFNIVNGIILTLLEHDINAAERSILMKLQSHLVESKESIADAISATETASTSISSLSRTIKILDTKLDERQDQLISLETEVSRISDEEGKLEAEIQRLTVEKNELVTRKKLAVSKLEQMNQEAFRDLAEWRNREEERVQAIDNWLRGKDKLAEANTSWKNWKEDLGF